MTAKMLSFVENERLFHVRVAGVCLHGDRALLLHEEGGKHWMLPGGRVHHDESLAEAIARELAEELGFAVAVERLLWIGETFFDGQHERVHELGFYYRYALPPGSPWLATDRDHVHREGGVAMTYRWFPVADLDRVSLVPLFLREHLRRIPDRTEVVVNREHAGGRVAP